MISKESQNFARRFLYQFDISVHFNRTNSWAKGWESHVALEISCSYEVFISCMCHELVHILAYREEKFYLYHHDQASNSYMHKHALRIERWVDRKAEKVFNEYFPDLTFQPSYRTDGEVKWLRDWLDREYPKS